MTIQTCGHVEKVDRGAAPGKIAVYVIFPASDAQSPVVFYVPEEDAKHWLVGNIVQLTAYSYEQEAVAERKGPFNPPRPPGHFPVA